MSVFLLPCTNIYAYNFRERSGLYDGVKALKGILTSSVGSPGRCQVKSPVRRGSALGEVWAHPLLYDKALISGLHFIRLKLFRVAAALLTSAN